MAESSSGDLIRNHLKTNDTAKESKTACDIEIKVTNSNDANDANSNPVKSDKRRKARQKYIKYRLSPIFLVGITGSLVASTQFGGEIYDHKNFSSPAFATWFMMSWTGILLPIVVMIAIWRGYSFVKCRRIIADNFRKRDRFSIYLYLIKLFPLCFLLDGAVFLANYAMISIGAYDITLIFLSTTPLIYLFTLMCNNQTFNVIKIFGAVLSIAGLIAMIFHDSIVYSPGTGIRMALASSGFLALYQIALDNILGKLKPLQVAHVLTVIGIYSLLTFWLPAIIFYHLGLGHYSLHNLPWRSLLLTSISLLIHISLVHLSRKIVSSRIVLISQLVAIMINGVIDGLYRQVEFDSLRISATVLLVIGTIVYLLPKSNAMSSNLMAICDCYHRDERDSSGVGLV